MNMFLKSIGKVMMDNEGFYIEIKEDYLKALNGIQDFSHIHILWWANGFDEEEYRAVLETQKPYKNAPDVMGLFATRSPVRPNPIMMTAAALLRLDGGKLRIAYIDAEPGTPVIDIKPYYPCFDFVTTAATPSWASTWPKSLEESAVFDWSTVFENAR